MTSQRGTTQPTTLDQELPQSCLISKLLSASTTAFFIDKEKIPLSYLFIAPTLFLGVILSGGALDPILGVAPAVEHTVLTYIGGWSIAASWNNVRSYLRVSYGCYLYLTRKAGRLNNIGQIVQPIFILQPLRNL